MAVRIVREHGEDILRERARPVKRFDDVLQRLIEDMFETMYHYHGIGLAAPQIGVPKRVIVMDVDGVKLALVNPEIIASDGEEVDTEGCLSVPGVYGQVKRSAEVVVRGLNPDGTVSELEATALLARCLQHEIDHLDGVLFIDKAIELEPVAGSEAGSE
ncbi:MAG: Peptide deformylase [Firmicutes bacterium]|nr:Peptide deformylase [candidate division NPL-UPA2 bacterium]